MRRRIGVSQNNILQGDNLQINNGSTASVSFNFTGESDLSFNLPGVDGSSGWALKTDGLGNLSFGIVASTGGATGATGVSGTSGTSGVSGTSGTSGLSITGATGTDGTNGVNGTSGTSGLSITGANGTSGTSGLSITGTNGTSGTSGTSGVNGATGPNGGGGSSGTSGTSGVNGSSGTSGVDGSVNATGTNTYVAKFTGATALGDSTITNTSAITNISFDNAYVRMTSDASRFYYQVGTNSLQFSGNVLSFGRIGTTAYSMRVDTVNDRVQFPDGSAATPSITFGSDLDTGIFRNTTNDIGISAAGSLRFAVSDTRAWFGGVSQVYFPNGTAALPAMAFVSDTDTGIYMPAANQVGISAGGGLRLLVGVSQTQVQNVLAALSTAQFVDGSAATPSITFTSDLDTGIYREGTNSVAITTGGVTSSVFSSSGVRLPDGSSVTPSISFISDNTMGLYRAGSNQMGFVVGGNVPLRLTNQAAQFRDGTYAFPTIAFLADTTTGFFRPGAGQVGVSTGGATAATFRSNGLTLPTGSGSDTALRFGAMSANSGIANPFGNEMAFYSGGGIPLYLSNSRLLASKTSAAASSPNISFQSDLDTGMYSPADNTIAISVGGVTNSVFGTTNSISAQTFFDKAVNHTPTTNASVSGTYSLDMSASNIFILTLTGNTTLTTTNRNVGSYMVYIKQDGTGGRTFNLSTDGQFLGATAVSIGTASNAVSILQLVCVGTQSVATSQKNLTSL